jgi:hypothetical protein
MARSELTRKNGVHLPFVTLAVLSASGPGRLGAERGWRDSCRRCRRQPGLRSEGLSRPTRIPRQSRAARGQLDIWMCLFGAAAQDRAASGCVARGQAHGTALVKLEQMRGGAGRWRLAGARLFMGPAARTRVS